MSEYPTGNWSGKTEWLAHTELASMEHAYESGEILGVPAHCLFGAEIDYSISMDQQTVTQQAALEASRDTIIAELSLLVPQDEEQAQRKSNWLQQVPLLTHKELINYAIYRRLSVATLDYPSPATYLQADESPETTLEFIFGKGIYQTGYYDNPGFFEMRTQAAKPTIAIERIQRAAAIADEVARSFGACFNYMGSQVNFSVWIVDNDDLRPVHTLNNSQGQEIARRATAGMLYALRDSMSAFNPPSTLSMPEDTPFQLVASPRRGGQLRVLPERFEQRLPVKLGRHVLSALALMSGFAYGVTDPTLDTRFVTTKLDHLLVPAPGYSKVQDLHLLRGLEESDLVNGRFVFTDTNRFQPEREEAMLSSIIGTTVLCRGNGSQVIEGLLGCISLAPDGTLEVDEQAFSTALQDASRHQISFSRAPRESITERLGRIKYVPNVHTITGSLDYEYPSGVTLHQDLDAFKSAPSLAHISKLTRDALHQERASLFTHDEAVSQYYLEEVTNKRIADFKKLTRLEEVLAQFPQANPSKVRQLLIGRLQKRIADLDDAMTDFKNRTADDPYVAATRYAYGSWQAESEQHLALLQGLGGQETAQRPESLTA